MFDDDAAVLDCCVSDGGEHGCDEVFVGAVVFDGDVSARVHGCDVGDVAVGGVVSECAWTVGDDVAWSDLSH